MEKESIIIIGAGGHTKSCIDVIESENKYSIYGIIGLKKEVGKEVMGYQVIGDDSRLSDIFNKCKNVLIGIGQIKNSKVRLDYFNLLKGIGFKMPSIISRRSYISSHTSIDEGSIFMHGSIINAGAKIGKNCIINTNAVIEHDVEIDSHCHISTGVIINGGTKVGEKTFIGSGSILNQSVNIGKNCFISALTNVSIDQKDFSKL